MTDQMMRCDAKYVRNVMTQVCEGWLRPWPEFRWAQKFPLEPFMLSRLHLFVKAPVAVDTAVVQASVSCRLLWLSTHKKSVPYCS